MSKFDDFAFWVQDLPLWARILLLFGFLFGLTILGLWIQGFI